MRKKKDFHSAEDLQLDEKAEQTLGRNFALPESVKEAQQNAFAEIRLRSGANETGERKTKTKAKTKTKKKRILTIPKTVGGVAAAAAVFSVICISNPALAENIPLIGHVFEQLGDTLGFSGDYSDYAKPLASGDDGAAAENQEHGDTAGEAQTAGQAETAGEAQAAAEAGTTADSAYSKTSDGVTVTLSEVYCNEQSLNLSMVITSEEPFPDTLAYENGEQHLMLTAHPDSTKLSFSYNPEFELVNGTLDGQFVDEHTYAGVLRIDLETTNTDGQRADEFYEARDAFLRENGFDPENMNLEMIDQIEAQLGMEEYSDAGLGAVGGPDMADYFGTIEIPETFSFDLAVNEITGQLPVSNEPEMPQELVEEYEQGLADLGLKKDDYVNYTDEQMERERQLFNKMWNQYYERYPEAAAGYNSYNSWSLTGDWNFHVDVEVDHTKTVTKEVNDIDENGLGVISATRTPFELSVVTEMGSGLYFAAVLDADGDLMSEYGDSTGTLAIQDHDVSKIDVYICDYDEYMDELKGYYWNGNVEESGYATFKELLDARALHHTEIVFDE